MHRAPTAPAMEISFLPACSYSLCAERPDERPRRNLKLHPHIPAGKGRRQRPQQIALHKNHFFLPPLLQFPKMVTLQRFEKAFPEIPPALPFSKGGEPFGHSMENFTFPPFGKGG